jgi:hypothetical protein
MPAIGVESGEPADGADDGDIDFEVPAHGGAN